MIKKIILKVWFRLVKQYYCIGFVNSTDINLPNAERHNKTKWLHTHNYKDGWFADPFLLRNNGLELEVLAEEFVYKLNRGIISLLKVKKIKSEYVLVSSTPILELSTHLSFPNYIEENGKIYVYPENYESGSLFIYEYDNIKKKLINPKKLVAAPLVDSAIVKHEGFYYLFGTINDGSGLDTTKKVEVYKAETLLGEYKHIQTISNEKREERGAGAIFKDKHDNIIRPVQCCNKSYGESLKLKQLIFSDKISEIEVLHLLPDKSQPYSLCLHTFNKLNDIITIDGEEYLYPIWGRKICPFIYRIIKLIKRNA